MIRSGSGVCTSTTSGFNINLDFNSNNTVAREV